MNIRYKILTVAVMVIIVGAIVVMARTYITAATYVPEIATVDVTSSEFVPTNLGNTVVVNGITPSSANASASGSTSTAMVANTDISTSVQNMEPATQPAVQTVVAKPKQKPPADYPAKLRIPSLDIDAVVQNTGITKRGSIGTPTNFTDVAWYVYGPIPGKSGIAIFDGHVDNGLGLPGVFKNLSKSEIGDKIEVVTNGGESLHFVVTEVASYDYKAVPVSVMYDKTGPSKIVLISCEGNWVGSEKTYDERLVVTAALIH